MINKWYALIITAVYFSTWNTLLNNQHHGADTDIDAIAVRIFRIVSICVWMMLFREA